MMKFLYSVAKSSKFIFPKIGYGAEIAKLMMDNNFEKILEVSSDYLQKHNNDDAWILAARASAQTALEKNDMAIASANHTLRIPADSSIKKLSHALAYLAKAQAYLQKKDSENLFPTIQEGLNTCTETEYPELRSGLLLVKGFAQIYFQNDYNTALSTLNTAECLNSANTIIKLAKSLCLFLLRNYQAALDYLEETNADAPAVLEIKAILLRKQGRLNESNSLLEQISLQIAESSKWPNLKFNALLYLGKYNEALGLLNSYSNNEHIAKKTNREIRMYYHRFNNNIIETEETTNQIRNIITTSNSYICNDQEIKKYIYELQALGYLILGQKNSALAALKEVQKIEPGGFIYDYTSFQEIIQKIQEDIENESRNLILENAREAESYMPRDPLVDYRRVTAELANSKEEMPEEQIQQNLKALLFITKLSEVINKYYIGCKALCDGSVQRRTDSWDTAVNFVDKANYITGSMIGVEGTIAIKSFTSAYTKIRDISELTIAKNFTRLAFSPADMEQLIKQTANQLALKYESQINFLTLPGVEQLAICVGSRMIQYVGSQEGKYSTMAKKTYQYTKNFIMNIFTNGIRSINTNLLPQQEDAMTPPIKQLLCGVLFGYSDTDEEYIDVSPEIASIQNRWTIAGILLKTGIEYGGHYYTNSDCMPGKYGYRKTTEDEISLLGYKPTSHERWGIITHSNSQVESTVAPINQQHPNLTNLTNLLQDRKKTNHCNTFLISFSAFTLGLIIPMLFIYFHAQAKEVDQCFDTFNLSGATKASPNDFLILSILMVFHLLHSTLEYKSSSSIENRNTTIFKSSQILQKNHLLPLKTSTTSNINNYINCSQQIFRN